jgi:lysophospholipase L1-like esterase
MRMQLLSVWLVVLLEVTAQAVTSPKYYLALGDSLAQGVQPSLTGNIETNQGYADDLFAVFRTRVPGLALVKLGCPAETTSTMIHGGICTYAEGSQLAAAISFVQTHRIAFINIDIGANDIDNCIAITGIDSTCFSHALSTVGGNLPQILAALRDAAGPNTPIIGMNYYDPLLAACTLGSNGQALAYTSLQGTMVFNDVLQSAYQAFSIPVADVAKAISN